MISKNKLKELAAYRLQKRCDEEAVFVVEGPKMASEAMASGFVIKVVCATAEWLSDYADSMVAEETFEVSPAELERLSNFKTANQIWMLLERNGECRKWNAESGLTLALDKIQDPGNMGTMLRTADWFGVRHVVCSRDTVRCYHPKVVRSTMGAIFRTKVEHADLPKWLANCNMSVFGASLQGKSIVGRDAASLNEAVLLIGNESRGISEEAMAQVTDPVLIPNIGGTAESLNAAVAAGILMNWMTK